MNHNYIKSRPQGMIPDTNTEKPTQKLEAQRNVGLAPVHSHRQVDVHNSDENVHPRHPDMLSAGVRHAEHPMASNGPLAIPHVCFFFNVKVLFLNFLRVIHHSGAII